MIQSAVRMGRGTAVPLAILALLAGSCTTEPELPSLQGSYSTAYSPPRVVGVSGPCDRMVSYAILSMGDQGHFGLSINIIDDCTRSEGGYSYGEIYTQGDYAREDSVVTFVTDRSDGTRFEGEVAGDYVTLAVPQALGVAPVRILLHLGPRQPF